MSFPSHSERKKLIPLIGMTLSQLQGVVRDTGLPSFSAKQIAAWLYKRHVSSIDEMTDISKEGRKRLSENYEVGINPPAFSQESADGTKKYLFNVGNGNSIESVYIPDKERATLCISSQAGCRMNCRFCATGRHGFHGNLTPAEIINQILSIPESGILTNIVFMGMGEPLDNIGPVIDVVEILTSAWGMEWSPKRITVSTIGKLDNLSLLLDQTKVHVALSVHSPYTRERLSLMPVEKAFPVRKVVEKLSAYDFSKQRRCSIEYIMWKDVNDDMEHAEALTRLLQPIRGVRVNLIRFHAIDDVKDLQPTTYEKMEQFRDYLNRKGITATIRASRGEDIMAACGMLAGRQYRN